MSPSKMSPPEMSPTRMSPASAGEEALHAVALLESPSSLDVMVDLDGCVYDFVDALACWIFVSTGRPLASMPPALTWDFPMDQWGLNVEEFLAHYAAGVNAGYIFTEGEPLPGARWGLAALRARGHRIHVITDRGAPGNTAEQCHAATAGWLRRHHIEVDSLTVSSDKTVRPTHVAVDDRDRNYDALEAAGVHPFLLDRPWNAHHPGRRVADWHEFVTSVDAFAGRL